MIPDKNLVTTAFSKAEHYDSAAIVQAEVARRLAHKIAARLPATPATILEIGCGTGLLSRELQTAFPASQLTLTDISGAMLARCRARLGAGPNYRVMDGEFPDENLGKFDLIASSLTLQWFTGLPTGIARLKRLLTPNGKLIFATLGRHSFQEWRQAHTALNLPCGLHDYPGAENLPGPARIEEDIITEHHPSGRDFAQALKTLGAGTPRPGYTPLPPADFRRLLATLKNEFSASYHILYVETPADS
jgi:malonyl-CoA O-methyltransferase